MNDFKGRHFEGEIVLWAVRCGSLAILRYGLIEFVGFFPLQKVPRGRLAEAPIHLLWE